MDFLDPKKRRRRDMLNIVGYGLIAIAILLAVRLLFYQAAGFGIDKNGKVVQSGLVFVASSPSGADVHVSSLLNKVRTNARLSLVSGNYTVRYDRAGYQSWQQSIRVDGGKIIRLDYATLYPKQLNTTSLKAYDAAVGLATQSPDRRWLLVQQPASDTTFEVRDLKNPQVAATSLTVPDNIITAGTHDSWQLDEWSNDNQHVLLSHLHDGSTEFVLLDRSGVTPPVNLNTALGVSPTKISLIDKKYDRYYVFDAVAQTLKTTRLDTPTLQDDLTNVLEYKTYSDNVVLYASSKTATTGKVGIVLLMSGRSYFLREVNGNTKYLLNLTQYNRNWYVAIGAQSENKVYVYKNPNEQLSSNLGLLVPVSVLKTASADQVTFSSNARFIMSEHGSQFSVYDAEVNKTYQYDTQQPLDAPQSGANWIDGYRLAYVSGAKLQVFDFNHTNARTLVPSDPSHLPFFAPDSKYLYTVAPTAPDGSQTLTSTALRTPTDL